MSENPAFEHHVRSIISMYAKAATIVKIVEKIRTLKIMFTEKAGVPSRKERIKSEPLLNGLISAKFTNIIGNFPSRPSP
jgi:hypothetical protein